jgi:tRNA (guanine-N7-)-methyltransferase
VQGKFVGLVVQALSPGGVFHVATDWQPYAEHIAEVVARESRLSECATPTDRTRSKFERRGVGLGHQIWEKAWSRLSGQPA